MHIKIKFKYRILLFSLGVMAIMLLAIVVFFNRLARETDRQALRSAMCMEVRKLVLYKGHNVDTLVTPRFVRAMDLANPNAVALSWIPSDGRTPYRTANWDGQLESKNLTWIPRTIPPVSPPDKALLTIACDETKLIVNGYSWLMARARTSAGEAVIAVDIRSLMFRVSALFTSWATGFYIPFALVLGLASAWLLAWYVFLPIKLITNAIKNTSSTAELKQDGLPIYVPEFEGLINDYNAMLLALNKSFQQAVRFSADAAHELKTPLTILQGRIEGALATTYDVGHQQLLIGLQMEVQQLSRITSKLLLLSQADSGHLVLDKRIIDWTQVMHELLADATMVLDGLVLKASIAPSLKLKGDEILLSRLCNNLIANAMSYCVSPETIQVSSRQLDDVIETRFRNGCKSLSLEQRKRLFDRFYRGEASLYQGTDGSGLGLSLSREIARVHGGDLFLENTPDDVFELRLVLPVG